MDGCRRCWLSTTNFTLLVRNRPRLTEQALRGLAGTDTTVTIIDDRSDEETANILAPWNMKWPGSRVFRNETPAGTGELRNISIEFSERTWGRGDYLYFSDNDVFFTPGWLEKLISAYEAAWPYGYRVLGAYNHPYNQPVSWQGNVYEVNHLASQSMLMRWSVWDEFGPFIETPIDKVCQSEDVVFSNKIREAGYKVGVISPWLVTNCGITNSFGEKIPGWELVKSQAPAGVLVE